MKRQILAIGCLLVSLWAMADDVQTVTVNGTTVNKTVTKITFEGDDVVFHYSDNTTDRGGMDTQISIAFQLSPTYIDQTEVNVPRTNRVYNLRGQYMGESLDGVPAGVYIVNGKKVLVK